MNSKSSSNITHYLTISGAISHPVICIILLALFLYIIVFSIIIFIKDKETFIGFYAGVTMLSVFFAYMFHKHILFHAFTFNHFVYMFLLVATTISVGLGFIGGILMLGEL